MIQQVYMTNDNGSASATYENSSCSYANGSVQINISVPSDTSQRTTKQTLSYFYSQLQSSEHPFNQIVYKHGLDPADHRISVDTYWNYHDLLSINDNGSRISLSLGPSPNLRIDGDPAYNPKIEHVLLEADEWVIVGSYIFTKSIITQTGPKEVHCYIRGSDIATVRNKFANSDGSAKISQVTAKIAKNAFNISSEYQTIVYKNFNRAYITSKSNNLIDVRLYLQTSDAMARIQQVLS